MFFPLAKLLDHQIELDPYMLDEERRIRSQDCNEPVYTELVHVYKCMPISWDGVSPREGVSLISPLINVCGSLASNGSVRILASSLRCCLRLVHFA